MNRKQKVVPSIYSRDLLSILEELGVAPERVLAQTELGISDLQDPTAVISYEEQLQIFSNAATLSPVSDLGMRLGQLHCINQYGLYGYAVQTCANYEQALMVACRYMSLTGVTFDLQLKTDDKFLRLIFTDKLPLMGAHRLFVDELLFAVHTIGNEIIQGSFQYDHISLSFSAKNYPKHYSKLLNCPIYFDKPHCEIVIDRKLGKQPLKYRDPHTSKVCMEQCDKILQRLEAGESFSEKVREIILHLPCDQRKAEVVAQNMHLSTRHLRRKLNVENTTFQKVLDEIRCELAKDYLSNTNLPLDDIAPLLGFSETSNFRRAFIKWQDISPSQFREQAVLLRAG